MTSSVPLGGRPELPIAYVRAPSPRARRHVVGAAIVATYGAAAVLAVAIHPQLPVPHWLALHLLLLGAATNAVLFWSRHFAQALLHARSSSERAAVVRLIVANAGIVAVLVGVSGRWHALTGAGAGLVVVAVSAHVVSLVRMMRTSRLAGQLRDVVWFYVVAGAALCIGSTLGGLMGANRVKEGTGTYEAVHLAHAHLNLFGWVGLTVLGTQLMLWPAVLRTRILPGATSAARRALPLGGTGLAVATMGMLTRHPSLELLGMSGYAIGVVVVLVPFAATARQRRPTSASAWFLAAGIVWFVILVGVDLADLADHLAVDQIMSDLIPLLVGGMVPQVLIGAMTFLLPVTMGRGPVGNRRLTTLFERGWRPRIAVGNAGMVLIALHPGGDLGTAGWTALLTAHGSFLLLIAAALATGHRRASPADPHV